MRNREGELPEKLLIFYEHLQQRYDEVARPYVRKRLLVRLEHVATVAHNLEEQTYTDDSVIPSRLQQAAAALQPLVKVTEALDRPFRIFVIGTGNVGKSTLINALARRQVAAVDFLPCTWRIDVYTHRQDGKAVVLNAAGHSEEMTEPEARKRVQAADTAGNAKAVRLDRTIRKINNNQDLTHEEKKQQREEMLARSESDQDIVEVQWPVNDSPFLSRFDLVDTPGMNQVLYSNRLHKNAKQYYEEADGVLWLLPAAALAAKDTMDQVLGMAGHFARKLDRTLAILNGIDCAATPQEEQMLQYEAYHLYGSFFSQMLPYSAKQACEAQQAGKPDDARTIQLLQAIDKNFYSRAQEDKLASVQENLEQGKQAALSLVDTLSKELAERRTKLETMLRAWRSELTSDEQDDLQRRLQATLQEAQHDLQAIAVNRSDQLEEMKDDEERNAYIYHNIFDYRSLEQAIENCVADRQEHLYARSQEYGRCLYDLLHADNDVLTTSVMSVRPLDFHVAACMTPLRERPHINSTVLGFSWGGFLARKIGFFNFSELILKDYKPRFAMASERLKKASQDCIRYYVKAVSRYGRELYAAKYVDLAAYAVIQQNLQEYRERLETLRLEYPTALTLIKGESAN